MLRQSIILPVKILVQAGVTVRTMVALVLMLHVGGRSLEDLRQVVGLEPMPRACTVGDWLRRMGGVGVRAVGFLSRHLARQLLRRHSRKEYTLDVDATVIEAEKQGAEWTYKKVKGYQPMVGFIAEHGLCLHWEFRGGNVSAGSGMVGFLESCLRGLPRGKRIAYFRSEGSFRLVVQRRRNQQLDLFDPHEYFYRAIATDLECSKQEVVWRHNGLGKAASSWVEACKFNGDCFGKQENFVPKHSFGWIGIGIFRFLRP